MNTDASDRVAPRFDRKKVSVSSQSELVFLIKNNGVGVSSLKPVVDKHINQTLYLIKTSRKGCTAERLNMNLLL